MKKLLLIGLLTQNLLIANSPTDKTKAITWTTPTKSICEKSGGVAKYGGCKSNFDNASKICSISGGRLPKIEELEKIITDCGGILTHNFNTFSTKNEHNKKYQSCYQKRGFIYYLYWSSDTVKESFAMMAYFRYGASWESPLRADGSYIRCVVE